MEVIIRVALLFLFIQFLVVMTIMTVALLLARQNVEVLGRESGHETRRRNFALVIHLPRRVFRSLARLAHSMHFLSRGR